ncbi:PIG-L deacetylase family protein [Mesorhizobium sp. B1-1-8]|uniref:PIG-L deacetylase family protein n=1 Tax=Mesorhizobium sp. B1-1-8 TaxID=2589976 RepID=UPI001D013B5E|nr:PIG-L family deacetylase [Mesorhizobium sp. B1-1-8]UCI09637.1 PIG-L family deacetylase [Mesorhizobium sp. B1-1-8]
MIVVAHPDDETIGIGGHLAGLPGCRIVHVTDGAPRNLADARAHGFETWQDYAHARRAELEAALSAAGLSCANLTGLDYPDTQAVMHLVPLAQELACLFAAAGTRFACTHPFEGGHPDHDATAFAVHAACHLLHRDRRPAPTIVEMAFYAAGPEGPIFQDFADDRGTDRIEVCLTEPAFRRKRAMLASHKTQQRTLAPFFGSTERFRLAPAYDFRALPNNGRLYYQSLPLGFEPSTWLSAAAVAHEELRLDQP